MQQIASHVLSLTPDYVSHWRTWEAARELLQNSLDQADRNPDTQVIFEYDRDTQKLRIGATNCRLEPKSLLLGHTTKSTDPNQRGNFGEGYKLAMLVFVRLMYDVKVYTGKEVWMPTFREDEGFGCHVLMVDRFHAEQQPDVIFEIGPSGWRLGTSIGIDDDNYGTIVERYLPDVPHDTILRDDQFKHKVFSGGLFVCEFPQLEWGYNFAPSRLSLNRDRDMPSTFDVQYASSQLWQRSGDKETVYDSVKRRAMDTAYVRFSDPDVTRYAAERFMEESGGAIPVTTHEEERAYTQAGHTATVVPEQLCQAVRSVHKFETVKKDTPHDRLVRFDTEHVSPHTFAAQTCAPGAAEEWAEILEASKNWTGPAY